MLPPCHHRCRQARSPCCRCLLQQLPLLKLRALEGREVAAYCYGSCPPRSTLPVLRSIGLRPRPPTPSSEVGGCWVSWLGSHAAATAAEEGPLIGALPKTERLALRPLSGARCSARVMAGKSNRDSIINQLMPAESLTSFTTATEYRVGSCWHCLINVPCPSLLTWLSLCMATLGWSVSGYMTASLIKKVLLLAGVNYDRLGSPGIDEICIIAIGVITVCIGIFFLVVATFSSESMSRYSFNTSVKNKTGRCINVVVLVLCYISVAIWSCICAALMVPMTVLGIVNMSQQCIHLDKLGIKQNEDSTCEIETLLDLTKEALVTLTICLAFAFVVQLSMAAFLVNVSSNIRHLKETRFDTSAGSGQTQLRGGELGDTAM